MMAFFPDDAHLNDAWFGWGLDNYKNRADLVWWNSSSGSSGGQLQPPYHSTRLGQALYVLWEGVKADPDNPPFEFKYKDVMYYDYEHQGANVLYIFGKSQSSNGDYY